MNCPTGKKCFDTEDLAVEALIQNHSRFHHGSDSGPINVYACRDCGDFHFTSKGEPHPMLNEAQTKNTILKAREAAYWESKFRGR